MSSTLHINFLHPSTMNHITMVYGLRIKKFVKEIFLLLHSYSKNYNSSMVELIDRYK